MNMKKTWLFSACLLGGVLGGNQVLAAQQDAADLMPSILDRQVSVGYYHNWPAGAGAGYQGGKPADIDLEKINPFYNVIPVAFMTGEGIPTFKPYNMSDQAFREKVAALNAENRVVLISLGGADSHIELHKGDEQAFADEVIRQVETYGFDGLDIDLEQTAVDAGDNQTVIPEALKIVREHYQKQGKHFIISMAPEFPYLRENGKYVPYIEGLKEEYDFIAPQLYNQAGDGLSIGTEWIAQNNDARKYDFLLGMSQAFDTGSSGFIQIPANRLALGLPANEDAAANGYVKDPSVVYRVFEEMERNQAPLKGIMTWSVNWDEGFNSAGAAYNESFAKAYGNLLGNPIVDTEKPTAPANLRAASVTANSVTLNWNASTDNVRVDHYNIYENGHLAGTSRTTSFVHSGLTPNTDYSYTVEAVDAAGNKSDLSNVVRVTTNEEAQITAPTAPRNLAVQNVTQNTITIEWSGNAAEEEVTRYEIFRNDQLIGQSDTPRFTDTNLQPSTSYSYKVRAVNAVGTSEFSQTVTAETSGQIEGTEWREGVHYRVGDIVVYQGIQYRCLQEHTSISVWAPSVAQALWARIG
ncbi:putative chitinase C1 [Enterococcus faecalis 13-SD-W-01]|nr:putative chitinase C1 [Enterococcus faecalis 13-SD-W-01]